MLLSERKAAAYLGVTNTRLAALRQQGTGPPVWRTEPIGRHGKTHTILYRKEDLIEWQAARLERQEREARP